MFSAVLAFGFVSFVFILDIHFSHKKLVLITLNAIYPEKICCNFSYKKLFWNKGITMHPDHDHLYIH